jgi:hypothetical protein
MKTAKSLVYGGELIEAIDCTYEDFKRLAPLCPNCSSPVHLKAGGDRVSIKGKPYKIPQHWAHFAGKSAEEVAACELRVNGYSDEEKEKIQRVARGQREKWIRRWLWRALTDDFRISPRVVDQHQLDQHQLMEEIAKPDQEWIFGSLSRREASGVLHEVASSIRYCFEEEGRPIASARFDKGYLPWMSGVDFGLHHKICLQIWDFLTSKNAIDLLACFADIAYLSEGTVVDINVDHSLLETMRDPSGRLPQWKTQAILCKGLVAGIQSLIDGTPWASEFARLEALEAAKAPHA